jgi:hypothetical protein
VAGIQAVVDIQAAVDIPFPVAVGTPCQDTAAVDSTPVAEERCRPTEKKFWGSGMFIRDPKFSIPDPGSALKNLSILTQKIVSTLSEIRYDPGCSSRIRILIFTGSRGPKRHRIPNPSESVIFYLTMYQCSESAGFVIRWPPRIRIRIIDIISKTGTNVPLFTLKKENRSFAIVPVPLPSYGT